jgi:hypothetical protein
LSVHVLASQEGEALHAGKHRGPFGLDILILNVSPSEIGRLLSERGGALAGGARHLDETQSGHPRPHLSGRFHNSRTLEAPAGRCRSTGRLTVGKKSNVIDNTALTPMIVTLVREHLFQTTLPEERSCSSAS